MCIPFTGIAQFPDVAHNLEILQDQEDCDESERSGKKDSGECRHAARNCFKYGQTGHLQQDDKKDTATRISSIRDVEYDIELLPEQSLLQKLLIAYPHGIYGVDKSNFHKFLDKFVIVLIDDILIFSKSNKEHEDQLCTVMLFQQKELLWIRAKLSCHKGPRPTSETEATQFSELAGHYHKVVEVFSLLALPLTKLTRKDEKLYGPKSERRSLKNIIPDNKICKNIPAGDRVATTRYAVTIVSRKDPTFYTFRILEAHPPCSSGKGYTNKLYRPLKFTAKLSLFP
ncbi:hypothetical protein Tco_0390940 [Tanacetum coccineum]